MFTRISKYNNCLIQSQAWFPRQVGYVKFLDFADWRDNFLRNLDKLKNDSEGVSRSNRGGWQSDSNANSREYLRPFMGRIDDAVRHTLEKEFLINRSIECTGAWANYNYAGDYNSTHTHPWSHISVIMYVSVPEGSGEVHFQDEVYHSLLADKRQNYEESFDKGLLGRFAVTPEEGLMLVFPSCVEHEVTPGTNQQPRVSVALNYTVL